jgi:hypothetical protein
MTPFRAALCPPVAAVAHTGEEAGAGDADAAPHDSPQDIDYLAQVLANEDAGDLPLQEEVLSDDSSEEEDEGEEGCQDDDGRSADAGPAAQRPPPPPPPPAVLQLPPATAAPPAGQQENVLNNEEWTLLQQLAMIDPSLPAAAEDPSQAPNVECGDLSAGAAGYATRARCSLRDVAIEELEQLLQADWEELDMMTGVGGQDEADYELFLQVRWGAWRRSHLICCMHPFMQRPPPSCTTGHPWGRWT